MKYTVRIEAYIDAKTDNDAERSARVMKELLGNPYVKALLEGQNVKLVGFRVSSKPLKG